jgi:zinc protease
MTVRHIRFVVALTTAALVTTAGLSSQTQTQKPAPAQKPAAASRALAPPATLVSKTLPNGLEIIVIEDHSVPVVTIELAVRNGSFTEPPELNGLSHLYEHLFFSPTAAPPRPIDRSLLEFDPADEAGIVYNGTTREEVVEYYYTTTTPNLPRAARTLANAARWPGFDPNALAREREVVIGELDRHDSNPFSVLEKQRNDRLFFKYPTRKEPSGTRATIRSATTDLMRTIQGRYYVPNNSAVIVTGDQVPADAFRLVESLFGDWAKRPVDPFVEFPIVEHPPLPKSEGGILIAPVQNVIAEISWQGPSVGKDNAATYAADVFSFILGQPNSRFQRALVDRGLATAADFGYYTQRNVGPISLAFQTTPGQAKAATQAVYEELSHFADPGYFTDEELESAKALLEADDLYGREELSDYVHSVAFWWSSTGLDYFRGYLGNLRKVTRADIAVYLKKYVIGQPHVALALMSEASHKASGLTEADLIGGVK